MKLRYAKRCALFSLAALLCMGTIGAQAAPAETKATTKTTAKTKSKSKTKAKVKTVKLIQTQTYKAKWKNQKGKITWKSSNKAVATVTKKGRVKAVSVGNCRITAKQGKKTYSFAVKVKPLALNKKQLNLICMRRETLELNNGKSTKQWKSSDPQVASVDNSGTITANWPGQAVITATYKGIECQAVVKVLRISPENLQSTYTPKENTGRVVLAGSSSVDYWSSAAEAFAPYQIVNTAIGGTTVVQWQNLYKSLITPYNPSAVVLYVGSNDIANGRISGEANAAATIQLLNNVRRDLKKIPIYYVSITPCWSRQGGWQAIAASNKLMKEYCDRTANVYFIDIASKVVLADGTPNPQLFKWDALHPNEIGYQIWKKAVGKTVVKQLKLEEKKAKKTKKTTGKKTTGKKTNKSK